MGLSDASTLAQLLNNSTFKVGPLVCMKLLGETKPAEEVSPQNLSHSAGLLVFCWVGLCIAGKVVCNHKNIFNATLQLLQAQKVHTHIGALLWILTRGALRPALGVFLRQHLSHCSHQALMSWNILGQ